MLEKPENFKWVCVMLGGLFLVGILGGCVSDGRKGEGAALVVKSEWRFLDSPVTHKWAVSGEPEVLTSVTNNDPIGSPFKIRKKSERGQSADENRDKNRITSPVAKRPVRNRY